MNRRTISLVAAAFALAAILLAVTSAFLANNTQASAPPKSSGAPAQPNAGVWATVAPLPTVTIDFTPGPQPLKLKRSGAAAYPPNGKIYVLGGRHGADGEDISMSNIFEYSPGSPGTWAQKAALLDPTGPGERYTANMAVAVLTDSANNVRIYAIGGNDINSNPTGTVRVYNPVADSVTTLTGDSWPAGSGNPAQHVPGGYAVYNNKLYIFGGFSGLGAGAVFNDTWVFDPTLGTGLKWRRISSANLSLARAYIAGAQLDGKIYAIGGDTWNSGTRTLVAQTIVERFDPANEAAGWTTVASLPSARGDMGAWSYNTGTGFEISGKILVAGGIYPVPDDKAFLYSVATNTWSSYPSLVRATRNYGVAQLNGLLYAFGGYDYSNNFPDGANFNQRFDATGPVPTATNTPINSPTATSTPFNTNYNMCVSTGTIDPGTTLVAGTSCDDCMATVNLPFAYTLYNQTFNNVELSSNGSLGFIQADVNPAGSCLPDVSAISAIFGYWDDLLLTGTGNGIYTSVSGTAPNRVFNIEWRGSLTRAGTGTVNFEIRLFEGQTQFEIVYGTVPTGTSAAFGTAGVQRDTGSLFTQYKCTGSGPNIIAGQKLTFTLSAGICPTNTPTFTPTNSPTRTSTVTGTPPTNTSTPTSTNTPCGSSADYIVGQSTGGTIVAGTTDIGNHCDDCTTNISLPFTYQLYTTAFNSMVVSSNGTLQFGSANTSFSNACLPQNVFTDAIFPFWDDLRTDAAGGGVFTSISGSAPNRIFNIEWRAAYFTGGAPVTFEVRLYEGQLRFDVIYGTGVDGTSATVGVQKDTGSRFTQFSCNTSGLNAGMQLVFSISPCITGSVTPTFTPTATNTPGGPTFTPTRTPTRTSTGSPTSTPTNVNTATATSTPSTCGPNGDYVIQQTTGASIVAGTTDSGNHSDDGTTAISIPFTFNFYGQSFTSVNASSNGNLQFSSANTAYANECLPSTTAAMNNLVAPFWDDLRTDTQTGCSAFASGCGIYTSVSGSSPNRIFNIEWRAVYYNDNTQTANFEVRLYEASPSRIDFVYGATADSGAGATVGVQRGLGPQITQFECNTGGLTTGLQLTFTQPACGTATPVPPTNTFTVTPTATCVVGAYGNSIARFAFNPQVMTITVGSSVTWTNHDSVGHTATSDTGVWDSGFLAQNDQFSFTFTSPGVYTYYCKPHDSMIGTINVITGCQPTPTITPTLTNTRTRTSTSTPEPTNTAIATPTSTPMTLLVGHVTWQSIPQPDARSQQPITLTLKSGATEVNYPSQSTDSSGYFTVDVSGLSAGTYSWRVKGPKWLANTGALTLSGAGTSQQEMGTMRAGDCNNDNVVNTIDFGMLKNTYGKTQGDPGYDARADFNGDNSVSIVDFNMLRGNFGMAGAPPLQPGPR